MREHAGFTVIYQDIIIGPALNDVLAWLGSGYPIYLTVLCPSPQIVAAREAGRRKKGHRDGWTPAILDRDLRETTPHLGLWLDTSSFSVQETVDTILARLQEAATR